MGDRFGHRIRCSRESSPVRQIRHSAISSKRRRVGQPFSKPSKRVQRTGGEKFLGSKKLLVFLDVVCAWDCPSCPSFIKSIVEGGMVNGFAFD